MKIKILSIFVALLLLPSLALATPSQCTSSQGLQINPSQVGVGDSSTATLVGSTTPTGENDVTMKATLQSLPDGLTLVSGQNPQQHTGITSATSKTYSWSIRGDVADSYQISVQLKCSDDTGTLQDTYSGSATVVEGITLDIDVTQPSSKSLTVTSGQTVTVKIWLSKSGEATANDVRATLTKPSGWSFVSGYQATETVASLTGGKAFEWKLRVGGTSSSGTISLSATSGSPSASDSDSISWSCTDCYVAEEEPEAPGTIPGGVPSEERKKSQNWTVINPGLVEIMHVDDPDIGLKQISINVRNRANDVKITVTKLVGKPATIVHNVSGKVYKYIEINAENLADENISEVKIQFSVNKTWIFDNNINRATIALNRYHENNWERLTTQEVDEDNDYVYYEAISPGFTTFAVTGEEVGVTTTTLVTTTTTMPVTTTTLPSEGIEGIPTWAIVLLVVVVIVIVIVVWRYRTKKETTTSVLETPVEDVDFSSPSS
jgi:PGF-pre-PGF domain-containing protein